ncbi:MAG: chromosome partitioning protein ParB, partial [Cyanobacteria bacterium J06648_11]
NEIRLNLTFFERGRICALSARDGVFPDTDAAVEALFRSASEAKRSKVRSFVMIYEALADVLQYPQSLSERLGLTLAKALKWNAEARLREGLVAAQREGRIASPEDEHREILSLCAAQPKGTASKEVKALKRGLDPTRHRIEALGNGLRLEQRCYGGFTDLRIVGENLDDDRLERAFVALKELLSNDDA